MEKETLILRCKRFRAGLAVFLPESEGAGTGERTDDDSRLQEICPLDFQCSQAAATPRGVICHMTSKQCEVYLKIRNSEYSGTVAY